MARSGTRDLSVGAMLALALIVLAVSVMAIGDSRRLFGGRTSFVVRFPTTDGLVIGSPVKMAGVQIGSVSDIKLSTDAAEPGIRVGLIVDADFSGRIREDSGAALRILQLLSGEKFVEIVPGTPDSPLLAAGGEIRPVQDPELLQQAAVAAENLNDITVSLKNLLESLESGEGLIGQMMTDPEFGRSGVDALAGSMENLRAITADLLKGEGFVGRLL
ncbi:MAG: MlaD family protein, partial [Acidobacteriota bacterium]|nr:MlaD family protein [Acidobacteriota bacterium]